MLPELLLLTGCILLTVWAGRQLWQRHLATRQLQENFYRAVLLREEARRYEVGRNQLIAAQIVTQKSVDVGTNTVRLAHNLIAAIPFTVLEQFPATREKAIAARKVHDKIAGNVYDSISIANQLIGHGLRQTLGTEQKKPAASDAGGKDKPK